MSDSNTIYDGSVSSTISGGEQNVAGSTSAVKYATIGGGKRNVVNGDNTTIAGGYNNLVDSNYGSIGGGFDNDVRGKHGTVGGGSHNKVNGQFGTVPGGYQNAIANGTVYSFAAGTQTNVGHSHSAVLGFSTTLDASNQCQSTEHGQILMCADSLDLSKVSRIDWGTHLQSALAAVLPDVDQPAAPSSTSTSTAPTPQPPQKDDVTQWYMNPILFIAIGMFVVVMILIGILFGKFASHSKTPTAHHAV